MSTLHFEPNGGDQLSARLYIGGANSTGMFSVDYSLGNEDSKSPRAGKHLYTARTADDLRAIRNAITEALGDAHVVVQASAPADEPVGKLGALQRAIDRVNELAKEFADNGYGVTFTGACNAKAVSFNVSSKVTK